MSFLTDRPVLIASNTVGTATASVTFSNIPNIYKSLNLIWFSATTSAVAWSNTGIRFNGDSGSNYYYQGTSTLYTSAAVGVHAGASTGSTGSSYSENNFTICDYNSSSRRKWITGFSVVDTSTTTTPTVGAGWYYTLWTGAAVITSLTFIDFSAGNIAVGSQFNLYGYP